MDLWPRSQDCEAHRRGALYAGRGRSGTGPPTHVDPGPVQWCAEHPSPLELRGEISSLPWATFRLGATSGGRCPGQRGRVPVGHSGIAIRSRQTLACAACRHSANRDTPAPRQMATVSGQLLSQGQRADCVGVRGAARVLWAVYELVPALGVPYLLIETCCLTGPCDDRRASRYSG